LNYFTFGSISAIAKYDPEELLLNGLDTVWVGVESSYTTLTKARGADVPETFAALHGMGIKTIGSWIAGLDIQNQSNIANDEGYFVGLNPTFQQISILTVEPSMPLARKYDLLKRRRENYPWENYHLYGQTFEPANFTYEELLDRVERLYGRLYRENGASIMRMLRVNMNGYQYCKRARNPLLRVDKSLFFERRVRGYLPLLAACREFAPSDAVREGLDDLEKEILDTFGPLNEAQREYREHVLRLAAAEYAVRGDGERPMKKDGFRRYVYGRQSAVPHGAKPYKKLHRQNAKAGSQREEMEVHG
jgi:hypothetical protein